MFFKLAKLTDFCNVKEDSTIQESTSQVPQDPDRQQEEMVDFQPWCFPDSKRPL